MKITEVNVHLLSKELDSSMRISRGGFKKREHAIVEVITDEGISGLGEGVGNPRLVKHIVEQHLAPGIITKDPRNIEEIKLNCIDNDVYFENKGSVICAASAIEMACWDIKGKYLNVPVFELLGGKLNPVVEAYASDLYWERDAARMAENAARIVDSGFTIIKMHIGVESPKQECIRIKAIRQAIGGDTRMMIDLNAGYNYIQALEACERWNEFDLMWLEEPVQKNNPESLFRLRNKTKIPIAIGENEFQLAGFKDLFDRQATDIAMPDVGRVGGISEAKNVCVLAQAYGIPVSLHNFSSGVLLAATLQIMATTQNCILLEWDSSNNAIYQDFFIQAPVLRQGKVTIPDAPGLGVELNHELLRYVQN